MIRMQRKLFGVLLACGSYSDSAAAPTSCTTVRWEQTARLGRSAPLLAVNSSACMCAAPGRVQTLFAGVRRAADATGARITSRRCQFDYARNTLASMMTGRTVSENMSSSLVSKCSIRHQYASEPYKGLSTSLIRSD